MQNQTQTIEEVVLGIVKLVGSVSLISMAVSMGITELSKRLQCSSRITAICAIVFGFLAGITVMKIFAGSWSSPLSLLVGGISALGGPGLFSAGKAIIGKTTNS